MGTGFGDTIMVSPNLPRNIIAVRSTQPESLQRNPQCGGEEQRG